MAPIRNVGVVNVSAEPCDHVSAAAEDTGCGASHDDHSPVAMVTLPPLCAHARRGNVKRGQQTARTGGGEKRK